MMHTLVGRDGFAQGMDAVLPAPRRPGRDLRRLRAGHRRCQPGLACWPRSSTPSSAGTRSAGTPRLTARGHYDADAQRYTLRLSQQLPAHAGQTARAMLIPVQLALFARRRPTRCRCSWTASARAGGSERAAGAGPGRAQLDLRRRAQRAGAVAAARLLGAGGAGRRPGRRRAADAAGPRHRPLQPLGSRPAPEPARACWRRCRPTRCRCWTRPTSQALRGVLRHPTLDPAFKAHGADAARRGLRRRAAGGGRPAAHPCGARAPARPAGRAAACRLGLGLRARTRCAAATAPRARRRPASARWPAWRWRCCAAMRARSGDPVWPGRAYQQRQGRRQHDRAAGRAERAGRMPAPSWPTRRCSASMRWRTAMRWSSTSGSRCRPRASEDPLAAAPRWRASRRCCSTRTSRCATRTACAALLVSLCRDNPAAFHRADAAGYVFWAERRDRAGRHQPAAGRPPGARDGPLEPPGRALPQRRARGHRPRRRAQRTQRRACARSSTVPWRAHEPTRQPDPVPGRTATRARPHSRPAAAADRGRRARLQAHRHLGQQGRRSATCSAAPHTENVQGEVQKKLDIISNEVLIEANEWGGHLAAHGQRGDGHDPRRAQPLPAGRVPAAVRPARRLEQHRRQRQHRHHLLGAAQGGPPPRRGRGRLPAAGPLPGRGRLLRLRPADAAGADRGQRRRGVHARPRDGLLGADRGERCRSPRTPRNSRST